MRFESARQVWEATFAQKAPGGGPKSTTLDSSDLAWEALERGKVVAQIAKLDYIHKAWGMRMCTNSYTTKEERDLYDRAFARGLKSKQLTGYVKTARYLELVQLALEDAVFREWVRRPEFSSSELCRRLEIPRQNWVRDWESVYGRLVNTYMGMTARTLGGVARLVDAEKEKRRA